MDKLIKKIFILFIIKFMFVLVFGATTDEINFINNEFLIKNLKPDLNYLLNDNSNNNNNNNNNNHRGGAGGGGGGKNNSNLDSFLSYWNFINHNKSYELTKDPITIVIPKLDERKKISKDNIQEFLFEHLVPGVALKQFDEINIYGNLNKNQIKFNKNLVQNNLNTNQTDTVWFINDKIRILRDDQIHDNLTIIYIDGYLGDTKHVHHDENEDADDVVMPSTLSGPLSVMGTEDKLATDNTPVATSPIIKKITSNKTIELKLNKGNFEILNNDDSDKNHVKYLINSLSSLKLGTKVFQHFLNKSNLGQIFDDNHKYNILIPIDNAFQRWHPIDWGFYPFSVQEFTENILRNHFLQMKTPLKMDNFKNMNQDKTYKTLGGEMVVFRNHPTPNVNNVTILSDHTLPNGNEIFLISEVLFVSEAIVSKLHQMHKDKETPPLLAFPWFGAQFLSHAFLALERDSRFTQITRFLNTAEIAQFVSGSNYTFFVPIDRAFEKLNFNNLADEILMTEKVSKMLLNHFIKGRLYDRDLKNDELFETLGGGYLKVRRYENNITINNARIVESEIFVYNLGTMFFIDEILYSEILTDKYTIPSKRDVTNDPVNTTTTARSADSDSQFTKITDETSTSSYNNNKMMTTDLDDVEVILRGHDAMKDEAPPGGDDEYIETETPKALPQISDKLLK